MSEDVRAALAAERRSRVSFEIEPLDGPVTLTVVHEGFEPGGSLRGMISQGWPAILSTLDTLLETGELLPEPPAGWPGLTASASARRRSA